MLFASSGILQSHLDGLGKGLVQKPFLDVDGSHNGGRPGRQHLLEPDRVLGLPLELEYDSPSFHDFSPIAKLAPFKRLAILSQAEKPLPR